MTELGYLSNHFFDGINTRFGINTAGLPIGAGGTILRGEESLWILAQ
jgi:hypothetical protein